MSRFTYSLTNDNALTITYEASSSEKTPPTLTNHPCFNLSGSLQEDFRQHLVMLDCSHLVELDEQLIPTEKILDMEGTPFDFRSDRQLTVQTDQPGVVMYTFTGLSDDLQLKEKRSSRYLGVCLGIQATPASLHHKNKDFPSIILEANVPYRKETTFTFDVISEEYR